MSQWLLETPFGLHVLDARAAASAAMDGLRVILRLALLAAPLMLTGCNFVRVENNVYLYANRSDVELDYRKRSSVPIEGNRQDPSTTVDIPLELAP